MTAAPGTWNPDSWQAKPHAQDVTYPDSGELARCVESLHKKPPLVTSWEVERLRRLLAEAEEGKRFVLQGGDCAESLDDCTSEAITNKIKILLQMSMVLVHGLKKPVVRVGRMAGQYAKPRSSPTETRTVNGAPITLPSYFGDLMNRAAFTPEARTPDPRLLLDAHQNAALTLNFVRALTEGGFADLHHPEYWDLSFLTKAGLPAHLRDEYKRMRDGLSDGLRFMEALGEKAVDDMTRVDFYTSHEGLNLWYESAQTRRVPRREGWYNLSTHLPWIGERTRQLDGAHVEFFRGLRNPIGVKLGRSATPQELRALAAMLNPANEAGRLVFITRMGASGVAQVLPPLLREAKQAGVRGLWLCDPMHGNTRTTAGGIKTRSFDDIIRELTMAHTIHADEGVPMGGVHFELTGDDVTECVGGAHGLSDADLSQNYASACDPRLNYHQALEMAFVIAKMARK